MRRHNTSVGRVTRRQLALSGLLLTGYGARAAAAAVAASPRAEIETALTASARGWSAGDLEAFMRVYEDSPDTTYLAHGGVVRGFRAIHDMYAARFRAAPAALGELTLALLAVRTLGPGWAEAIGRFALHPTRAGAAAANGVFTLLFHHTPGGWKIASDHTS